MTERKRLTVAAFTVGWLVIAERDRGRGGGDRARRIDVGPGGRGGAVGRADLGAVLLGGRRRPRRPRPRRPPDDRAADDAEPDVDRHRLVGPGLTHKGDLRFFLLPVPSDGSVIGDPDGKALTKADVAGGYSNSKEVTSILGELGFKGGATRDYQTGDAKYHVEANLMQFGSASNAKLWFQGDQPASGWKTVKLSGLSGADGLQHPRQGHQPGDAARAVLPRRRRARDPRHRRAHGGPVGPGRP